jgi:hypothetical protein
VKGNSDRIVFDQPLGITARWILGGFGAAAFLAPYELLWKSGVPLFRLAMIPYWFIGLGAGAIGTMFLAAAILGLTRTVIFDPHGRQMMVEGNGSFGIAWRSRYPFADILEISVIEDPQTSGASRYVLLAVVANARGPVEIDTFGDLTRARAAEAAVHRAMMTDA